MSMKIWQYEKYGSIYILVYTSILSATMECMARIVHIKVGALTVSMPREWLNVLQ